MSYETADILDGAADVIEKRGWIQNDFENENGVCIREAMFTSGDKAGGANATYAFYLTTGQSPIRFNDTIGRTKQEVLDALRLAAKNERVLADDLGGDAA